MTEDERNRFETAAERRQERMVVALRTKIDVERDLQACAIDLPGATSEEHATQLAQNAFVQSSESELKGIMQQAEKDYDRAQRELIKNQRGGAD